MSLSMVFAMLHSEASGWQPHFSKNASQNEDRKTA